MWSLHAEQTCQIDATRLDNYGLAVVPNGQNNDCLTASDFTLYSASSHDINNGQKMTCNLQCKGGWHWEDSDTTPTMSCNDNTQNPTSPSGASHYTRCTGTWYIMYDSHNGIVCRIGDLLW